MPASVAVTASVAALSLPLKDLYESGKHKYKEHLSKWNNTRNIKALTTKVSTYEQVKTIWHRDKKVKLSSFYYPSRLVLDNGLIKQVKSLRDLPQSGGIVIQGTVGQGKSMFLRYLCVQELSEQASGRIPVFAELRKLESGFDLKAAIFSSLESLGFEISDELFEHYADSGKIVILLDGFDEIDEGLVLGVVSQLEAWIHRYPQLQFIITSRPGGEIQKSSCFTVIPLAQLGSDEHRSFMTKIGVKGQTLDQLITAIDGSPVEIRGLLTTPLLVTLLVLVYQSEGIVPNELPEFFKLLFSTVFSRHDRSKPAFARKHKSGLNERKLEHLFEAFCFSVLRRKFNVHLKNEQFEIAFQDAVRFSGETSPLDGFKHDVVKVACLLQEDGFYTSFIHKSLLDFFPASFIRNCTDEQADRIYSTIASHWNAWVPVLQFLEQIDRYRFAKYFAIPELERLLSAYGVIDGCISDECIKTAIEKSLLPETHYSFALDKTTGVYIQKRFGPYYSKDSFFQIGSSHFIDHFRIQSINKMVYKHRIEIEDGEERYLVQWRDSMDDKDMKAIQKRAFDLLRSHVDRLSRYRDLVAEELKKADEMVALDVWQ